MIVRPTNFPNGVTSFGKMVLTSEDPSNYGLSTDASGAINTVAIQTAINNVIDAGGGNIAITDPGTYLLNTVSGTDNPYVSSRTYCIDLGDGTENLNFYIGPGVVLKLANTQQVNRTVTGTGAVDLIIGRNLDNVKIYGEGEITGNTAGQTGWTGGYAQVSSGCIIYLAGSTTVLNENITIEGLYLYDHFSNPVQVEYGNNINLMNLRSSNCGEGFQVSRVSNAKMVDVYYEDTTNVTVGDAIEFSSCDHCILDRFHVFVGPSGEIDGSAVDLFRSVILTVSNGILENTNGGIDAGSLATIASDLVVDASDNKKVTSASKSFTSTDINTYISVYGGTSWTKGLYKILSTSSNAAILDFSPAATGTTGGSWAYNMVDNLTVSNLSIDRDRANALTGSGGHTTWSNITITNSDIPLYVEGSTYGVNQVSNLKATYSASPGYLRGNRTLILNNASFDYSASDGFLIDRDFSGAKPTIVWNGGSLSNNGGNAIEVAGNSAAYYPRGIIQGVIMIDNTTRGITASGSAALNDLNLQLDGVLIAGPLTNFVVDGSVNTRVLSPSYSFTNDNIGQYIEVTSGASWTTGRYLIGSITSSSANVDRSPAAAGTSSGTAFVEGKGLNLESSALYTTTNNRAIIWGKTSTSQFHSGLKLNSSNRWDLGTTLQVDVTQTINPGTTTVGGVITANNNINANGDIIGDGGDPIYGFLTNVATSTTGKTLLVTESLTTQTNASATTSGTWNLPAAAAGLIYKFVVIAQQAMDINPATGDIILGLADATGDAIRSSTTGNTITLEAVDSTNWIPSGVVGSWTDIN